MEELIGDKPPAAVINTIAAAGTGGPAAGQPAAPELVMRARIARLLAGFIAMSSSLAAGAWIAALLAGIIIPSGRPSSSGERALIGVVAIAAVIGVALLHVRTLRPAWSSAPSVIRHIRPSARALVTGGLTFGALELVAAAAEAVFGTPPLGEIARVALAGATAAIGLVWQRFRLDERLQRFIG